MMLTYRAALAELSGAQKSRSGVSLYTRYVNRPFGRVLAAACYVLRMSPNQVTVASAALTALGLIILIAGPPVWWRGLLVAAILATGFALDSADGQVARLTGLGSRAGEWLDHVVDSGKVVAVHACVLIIMYRFFEIGAAFLLPLLFMFIGIVTFFGGELHRLLVNPGGRTSQPDSRSPSLIRAIGLLPADYGVLAVSFMLIGYQPAFTAVYTLLLISNAIVMILLLAKWFRSLSALTR